MLVELSVLEQRYRAVLEVESGCPVTEVAERFGVSRQSVHAWLARYRVDGLAGLADRSHRPVSCPHRVEGSVEALVCELRRSHPRWGPARLAFELSGRGVAAVPSQATLYRILVRNGLITPGRRGRARASYLRWEREAPMALWQLDVMGGVFLAGGAELKLVTGIDDHSRFVVVARLVVRASSRAVCAAFVEALGRFGVPEEVLTDNGKQFTGRFTKPRPAEVLFERICRDNGITARTTRPRSPTTTGKIERWHKTLREEFLATAQPFATLADAQAALDVWVDWYNTTRPHQSLDMTSPASRFLAKTATPAELLPVRVPADLAVVPVAQSVPVPAPRPLPEDPLRAVEFDRIVPASGNMTAAGRQIWMGPHLSGQQVTVWVNATTLHIFHRGEPVKTLPVRVDDRTLARMRATGGREGRPAPSTALPLGALPADAIVQTERTVNAAGCIAVGGKTVGVGIHLSGRRVTVRIDAQMLHVLYDGALQRTLPSPLTAAQRGRLQGGRLVEDTALPTPQLLRVTRVVSAAGALMVAGCKLQVGTPHRGKVVTVEIHDTFFRILHNGDELSTHPRTLVKEVTRRNASGHAAYGT